MSEEEWFTELGDPGEQHAFRIEQVLVDKKTDFQHLTIIENDTYGKVLFLDGASQSAEVDEYIYHETLIHPALLLHSNPQDVLILGGGEGASLREVLRHRTVTRAAMVDIDGELVECCKTSLPEWSEGAYSDPRAELIIADGKVWIEKTDRSFDVIVMDLTDQIDYGPSFPLYTQEFFRVLSSRLKPGGILIIQAGCLSIVESFSHASVHKTLKTIFTTVESYLQFVPSFFAEWSFIVASSEKLAVRPEPKAINDAIAKRIASPLHFYNGQVHNRIFTISPDLQTIIDEAGVIVRDEESFKAAFQEQVGA
jgi:spermidine synthase